MIAAVFALAAALAQAATPAPAAKASRERGIELLGRGQAQAAVVELEGSAGEALPTSPGQVDEVERTPERIRIVARAEGPAVLVVNDAYWPGWRATLDGREVPIAAAGALVRAVAWPPGRHVLEMTYAPPEVGTGLAISALGAAALAGIALAARRRRRAGEGARARA